MSKSAVTDIEYLSKTRATYANELSFAGRGLKLNTREDARELVDAMLKCPSMEVVRLEGNTISPEAAEELAKGFVKHGELKRFIANDIFTGRLKDEIPKALKSICGAIEVSGAKLVELNMSDNAYGPIGLTALIEFLQSSCCYSLKEIRMHNNGLGPDGSKKFADAMLKCHEKSGGQFRLRTFICGRNRLEYEGAKSISHVLKTIGTLEEIQMPQNGIRPNAIEFLADACAHNPELRVVNFNDNTFRKIGGEQIAKAFSSLKKLEYLNLGDCLLRNKGAVMVARSLANMENIKEIILSFNEINLNSGLEIAGLLLKCKNTLQMLDLNGNSFGEEGKLEIKSLLQPIGNTLGSLSEDEGSEEEAEEDDDDDGEEESDDEEEEEEDSEVVVDGEDDYDQVDEYDEEEDDDEEDEDDEEEYEDEEEDHAQEERKPPQLQQPLFTSFKTNKQEPSKPNLFSNMIQNTQLLTKIEPFDSFIRNSSLVTLGGVDESVMKSVANCDKFNATFLFRLLAHLAKIYDHAAPGSDQVLNCAKFFVGEHIKRESNLDSFANDFLTHMGFLKSEEKSFKPVEAGDKLYSLLSGLQASIPAPVKGQIVSYLNLRNQTMTGSAFNPLFKKQSESLIKCLS